MTDNKINTIIFFVLSILIFFGYQYFFAKPDKNQLKKPAATETSVKSSPAPGTGQSTASQDFQEEESSDDFHPSAEGRLISVDTPLYHGIIDTAGGRIYKWELKRYKETTDGSTPVDLFRNSPPGFSSLLRVKGYSVPELIPFEYSGQDNVSVEDGTAELTFTWKSPEGLTIKKVYGIDSSSYVLKQRFEVTNPGSEPLPQKLDIKWFGKVEGHGRGGNTMSFVALVSGGVENVIKRPKEAKSYSGVIDWFGFSQKYFTTTFLPETGADTSVTLASVGDKSLVKALYSYPGDTIPPGKTSVKNWEVYLGPLEYDIVKAVGYNLQESINYGWVEFLAKPLLDFLKWLNSYFHNYGISIIVITLIMRLIFLPLTVRSMVSMKRMQVKMEQIKPKIDALKEKFKDDKTKQNSELMKLYSSHGINPLSSLGGCLPLLIQLPVFIALYDVLLHSIDLRQSSFLWINDLSEPEHLFNIPGIGIPFRILPLVMGVSWFISQKMTPMTPTAGNENMQMQMKMMQFMPIIFTVMFWGLPSGLILYWTVSNMLSIGQQVYVNRL
ncbi:MAG TPA: membrane protein insertase YidC, partial [Thermodesulfobacteriota bacterium]|nr:membrane protein insertase YidC [Thermodesulfobacteriota bacterium]